MCRVLPGPRFLALVLRGQGAQEESHDSEEEPTQISSISSPPCPSSASSLPPRAMWAQEHAHEAPGAWQGPSRRGFHQFILGELEAAETLRSLALEMHMKTAVGLHA